MIVPTHLLTRQALERFRRDKENPEMTEFGKLDADGTYTHVRTINQSSMLACPNFIMLPEHYREDESCRCNDPDNTAMRDAGYTWDAQKGQWS